MMHPMSQAATALRASALALALPAAGWAETVFECSLTRVCVNAEPCSAFEARSVYRLDGPLGPGDSGDGTWALDDDAPAPVTYEVDHAQGLFITHRATDGTTLSRLATMTGGGLAVDSSYFDTTGMAAVVHGLCRKG
jgi:hypothetical protein